MKNVFLTGATGFVGPYLLRALLRKGYRVFALYRQKTPMMKLFHKVEWMQGDILDLPRMEHLLEGMQQVYHAAAAVSFNPRKQAQTLEINAQGTDNIVQAALLQGVEELLYVSSIAALGRKDQQLDMHEDLAWENNKLNSPYAIAKFQAEMAVWRGMEQGLQASIINPGIILGAGDWQRSSAKLFRSVAKGMRYYPRGSSGFIDVRDVADLALACLDAKLYNQRYIAVAENLSYQELFGQMARALSVAPPQKALSNWMGALAWRGEALRSRIFGTEPLITRETVSNAQLPFVYRNEKLRKALPEFSFRSISSCIEETARIYREQGDNPFALLDDDSL